MALFTLTYKAGYIWEQGKHLLLLIAVDGSLSDTTVDNLHRNQRMNPRGGSGGAIRQGPDTGLGKKSNSTSQLSAAGNDQALKNSQKEIGSFFKFWMSIYFLIFIWKLGHKRRLGLIGAKRTTITVHRSEEVLPGDAVGRHLVRQGTSASSEGDVENDLLIGQEGERWEFAPLIDRKVDSLGISYDGSTDINIQLLIAVELSISSLYSSLYFVFWICLYPDYKV